MKKEKINKLIFIISTLILISCQFDTNKTEEVETIPVNPEFISLSGHSLPSEFFKYTDTFLITNSHTIILKGSPQTLIEDIIDSTPTKSFETIRMRFVNNPWALSEKDSIFVVFGRRLVYSGNFIHIIDMAIPYEIMNKKIIVQFITKKNGVICYYNSNENYQWYFMDPNIVGVDFVFLTGKTDFPPFYLNFINKSEVHYPELYLYKKSFKDVH
jgi:hypothetical protein